MMRLAAVDYIFTGDETVAEFRPLTLVFVNQMPVLLRRPLAAVFDFENFA